MGWRCLQWDCWIRRKKRTSGKQTRRPAGSEFRRAWPGLPASSRRCVYRYRRNCQSQHTSNPVDDEEGPPRGQRPAVRVLLRTTFDWVLCAIVGRLVQSRVEEVVFQLNLKLPSFLSRREAARTDPKTRSFV